MRQQTRERVRKYCERKVQERGEKQPTETALTSSVGHGFKNQTSKKRATDKV